MVVFSGTLKATDLKARVPLIIKETENSQWRQLWGKGPLKDGKSSSRVKKVRLFSLAMESLVGTMQWGLEEQRLVDNVTPFLWEGRVVNVVEWGSGSCLGKLQFHLALGKGGMTQNDWRKKMKKRVTVYCPASGLLPGDEHFIQAPESIWASLP